MLARSSVKGNDIFYPRITRIGANVFYVAIQRVHGILGCFMPFQLAKTFHRSQRSAGHEIVGNRSANYHELYGIKPLAQLASLADCLIHSLPLRGSWRGLIYPRIARIFYCRRDFKSHRQLVANDF